MGVIDAANKAPLTVKLFEELLAEVDSLPAEDRADMTARTLAMIRYLKDARVSDEDRASILISVQFRMIALARLHDEPAFGAWSLKARKSGPDYIHRTLIETAATHPLIERNGDAALMPTAFSLPR